jgi:hypothetical protein
VDFPPPELKGPFDDQVMILGNPPWVTNATLSALESKNLPTKSNFKGHSGFDALTGKSNFDIAEFILLKLIRDFTGEKVSIAMLCKNTVIRNLVEATKKQNLPITNIQAFNFDAASEFDVACDASLFVADITNESAARTCNVSRLEDVSTHSVFGWVGEDFVSNVSLYTLTRQIEGVSPFVWRQGIKHDCSGIMELDVEAGRLRNGLGQDVLVESERVFPLAKSSDLKYPILKQLRKAVIVPQNAIGEDTTKLKTTNPRLWDYLNRHAEAFAGRKSSIYKDKPPFSIFGVGDYSFKPYKIGLSGFYKMPNFSLLMPVNDKPVMLDDTCYLLGFDKMGPALVALALLNGRRVQEFLKSIIFLDSKRPYTKELLMRIDLAKVASLVSLENIREYLSGIGAPTFEVGEQDVDLFRSSRNAETQGMFVLEKTKPIMVGADGASR